MSLLFPDTEIYKGACFSRDRLYRYLLWRIWDKQLPKIAFIGLNPSTADEGEDDRTIGRVIEFATTWGYGGVYMANLFGLVSKKPEMVQKHRDPVGLNQLYLEWLESKGVDIVFAWGNFKVATERAQVVIELFPNAKALVLNQNGTPRHPLYVPGNTQRINFK